MNYGNGTHWKMPDRHIRLVEEGDTIDSFRGRERTVKKIGRHGSITFEDGMVIDVGTPNFDDVTVLVFRPRAKMRDGWNPVPSEPGSHSDAVDADLAMRKPKAKRKPNRKPGPVTVRKVATS